jgi:type VI secretion system ImpA family protein
MSAKTFSSSVDLEQLLSPISGEHPAGESLRYEGTYDRIRESRREDDSELSQGIYKTDLKKADWNTVESMCLEVLETRSKDLQVATWLLEAWLHQYGFSGVRKGLRLLAGLCEGFWNDLYPELEGDDSETRVSPVVWVNEKLSTELKRIPITSPQSNDVATYSFADWENACHMDELAKRNPGAKRAAEASIKVTPASFQASVLLSEKSFYVALFDDLNSTMEACLALGHILDERCENNSPSLHQFKETLGTIQHLTAEILRARTDDSFLMEEYQELPVVTGEHEQEPELWSGGPIRSRAEAYQRLSEAADYLLRTEPHSPTPYLVKRAVAWGSMSLFELYRQIVRNEGEMEEINRLLRLATKEGEK